MSAANHLVDLKNAAQWELLFVEFFTVDRDKEEGLVGSGGTTQHLDGADSIEHYGIDAAILDVGNAALSERDEIAVVDERLHGAARATAPEGGMFEAWRHYPIIGIDGLVVFYFGKTSHEIDIVERD